MIEELRDAPLDIIAEVANVPVIRKPSDYDSYNNTAEHLRRRNWYKAFRFAYPEDIYLGISNQLFIFFNQLLHAPIIINIFRILGKLCNIVTYTCFLVSSLNINIKGFSSS